MSSIRILHTSHTGLPDPRIEKTALVMKREGHEMFFLGGRPIRYQGLNAFEATAHEPMASSFGVAIEFGFKKRWLKAVDKFKPDVIHAHNLIAAAMMLDTDYPVIYDDHENWGRQLFKYKERGIIRRMFATPLVMKTPKWEREILQEYPVITVSEANANDHRRYSDRVFITHNYPSIKDFEFLNNRTDRQGLVYVGGDFSLPSFLPHRDMSGLKDILDFDIISGMPHSVMMERLTHYRVGLVPWKPFDYQKCMDPNKNYEYLHAGLQVVLNPILKRAMENDPYVHPFNSYSDIREVVETLPPVSGEEVMDHARRNYVWEMQEDIIKHVYRLA